MISQKPDEQPGTAAVMRLAALTPLDDAALAALSVAIQRPRSFRMRRDIVSEGHEIVETFIILSGWAARVRILEDGRRQIIGFLLPGDLIGFCDHDRPLALSTVIPITDVDVCVAPKASVSSTLARAYALSRAHDEKHLLAQITRLGRLNALERIADFLLEVLDRLSCAGIAHDGRFVMPLTQEIIADVLGLTSVHVNRMLQMLRRDDYVIWKGRELVLPNPAALARSIGRTRIRVAAD